MFSEQKYSENISTFFAFFSEKSLFPSDAATNVELFWPSTIFFFSADVRSIQYIRGSEKLLKC